jgi:hypothetical protein
MLLAAVPAAATVGADGTELPSCSALGLPHRVECCWRIAAVVTRLLNLRDRKALHVCMAAAWH